MWNGAGSEEFHSFSLHLPWGMLFISDSDGPQPVGAVQGIAGGGVFGTRWKGSQGHLHPNLYSLKLGILRSRCGVDRIDHQVTDRVKVE